MLTDLLLQYGLFLAKVATVVVAIGALALLAFALRRSGADGPGDAQSLQVKKLNTRLDGLRDRLADATLPPAAQKARRKARKAERKAEKRARSKQDDTAPRLFVLGFRGDIRASAVASLREEVTALLTQLREGDEVLVRLENAGGTAHEHGLAASQLLRLREAGAKLTVAVDKVAASGGYMMACVAHRIIAAPFAILGSIGVLLQLPNFNRLLREHGVEYEQVKGGEFKRTLTVFGENTDEGRAKAQAEVEDIHALFKAFVAENRPQLDIDAVATGEHWFGRRALELNLCDAIQTSDDYLMQRAAETDVFELRYRRKRRLPARLGAAASALVERLHDIAVGAEHARRVGAAPLTRTDP